MKAEELRIGNWVNRQYFNPYPDNEHFAFDACRIERIAPNTANLLLNDNSIIGKYKLDSLNPIPLTPEILEAVGFEYNRGWNAFSKGIEHHGLGDYFLGVDMESNVSFVTQFSIHDGAGYFPCRYVHQLQNLYYSLTGQELTINLHAAV